MLLGFDIGGTKCSVILGRETDSGDLQILSRQQVETKGDPYKVMDTLADLAFRQLETLQTDASAITGIGISCGGPLNSKEGLILSPPNLPGWDQIPVVSVMQQHFAATTMLQNDANAGAVAEWKYGAGKGYNNVIFLTFGTGMGSGLILNGQLYSGASDMAGEVGHIRLTPIGPVGYGKAGSFEGFCSGGGIAQLAQIKAREYLQQGKPVGFCENMTMLSSITAKSVAAAADAGDELARQVYTTCADYLGQGLAVLIDILNPEIIVLGSIYNRSGHLLRDRMHEILQRETLPDALAQCQIKASGLGESIGDYAALSLASMASTGK